MIREREKVGNDIYGVKSNWKFEEKMQESAETGFRHNDRYHKYFHGYTEVRIDKGNGKYKIERVYTDDWYAQDISDGKRIAVKLLMPALSLISLVLYVWLMSLPNLEGNVSRLVAIPGFVSIVLMVVLLASAVAYAFTNKRMTWWEQHSSNGRINRYSLITGTMLELTAVLIVLNIFIAHGNPVSEILLALGVAFCGACDFAMYFIEKSINYKTIENHAVLPEGEAHLIL